MLKNEEMLKGSELQLWYAEHETTTSTSEFKCFAFATSHQLSVQRSTEEIATKDHGDYTAVFPTTIAWSITSENMFTDKTGLKVIKMLENGDPILVKFAKVKNYVPQGIIDTNNAWYFNDNDILAEGKAIITNYQVTAQAGSRSTCSIELQGVGPITYKDPDVQPSNGQ